nr:Dihydrofolate reductase [uncultured bacterium]
MAIIGIVAVDKNNAIGKGGQLPWHYSSDMKFFRGQTMGHACVMGYKTWRTLKKPLPGRLNLVLSRRSEITPQASVVVMRDKLDVLSLLPFHSCDLFIIGGRQIYDAFLGEIDRWLVTEVPLVIDGADTFMPANFLEGFDVTQTLPLEEGLSVKFYDRNRGATASNVHP